MGKPKESMADTSHASVGVAVDMGTPSVFESMPAETKASVGHSSGCQLPDTNEASVFESKPRESTAHVSSERSVLPDMEGPSVCESNPDESKASARAGTLVNDTPEGPTVCESTPAISRASITAADAVPIPDGGVCESQPVESSLMLKLWTRPAPTLIRLPFLKTYQGKVWLHAPTMMLWNVLLKVSMCLKASQRTERLMRLMV